MGSETVKAWPSEDAGNKFTFFFSYFVKPGPKQTPNNPRLIGLYSFYDHQFNETVCCLANNLSHEVCVSVEQVAAGGLKL